MKQLGGEARMVVASGQVVFCKRHKIDPLGRLAFSATLAGHV